MTVVKLTKEELVQKKYNFQNWMLVDIDVDWELVPVGYPITAYHYIHRNGGQWGLEAIRYFKYCPAIKNQSFDQVHKDVLCAIPKNTLNTYVEFWQCIPGAANLIVATVGQERCPYCSVRGKSFYPIAP